MNIKKYHILSIIVFGFCNSICLCYAQEPEITSSPRYADRNVINRILLKEPSTKINITTSQEGSINQPDIPRGKIYKSTSFGACDIFDKMNRHLLLFPLKMPSKCL